MVGGAGLAVAAVASGAVAFAAKLTLLHQDMAVCERALQRLHDLIAFAAQVSAPLVTIGSLRGWVKAMPDARWSGAGAGAGQGLPRDGLTYLCSTLQTACQWAGEHGVRLVIEPLNRYEADAVATAQDALDLISAVGSPCLGMLLDTYHVNIEEASPVAAASLAAKSGRLWHVHLGDSNRWPPGQGHFDFSSFVRALFAAGYTGYLSAELLGKPDPDTAARLTAEYMRQLLAGHWPGGS
jgi:sugar phosphate isomerase/epimerase